MNATTSITFVICSRNDDHGGNPMWRLQTSVNFLASQIEQVGGITDYQIIISDWGSDIPIANMVRLSATASRITSFLYTPPPLASALQRDSPFAEVYAINAAVRRADGAYIARIDQDTLVPAAFLREFSALVAKGHIDSTPIESHYYFSPRKQLPYRLVLKEPSSRELEACISRFGGLLAVEVNKVFWHSAVGILLAHRRIWQDVGGYDERLIYYHSMDIDLGIRIKKKYEIVNIGALLGYHFCHLEHFPNSIFDIHWKRWSIRKKNPDWALSEDGKELNPNGNRWGLADEDLALSGLTSDRRLDGGDGSLTSLRWSVLMSAAVYVFIGLWRRPVKRVKRFFYFRKKWIKSKLAG